MKNCIYALIFVVLLTSFVWSEEPPVEWWVVRYNGLGNSDDGANAIAIDNSGNVYVTGYSYGSSTGSDYATIKYDPNGNERWVAHYNGPGNSFDSAYAIALDNFGNVYVTGSSYGGIGTYFDYATIKYDSNGNQEWVVRYNGPRNGYDEAYALAIDSCNNVYVTGGSEGNGTDDFAYDYTTIKYDTNGSQLWVARYDGPTGGQDNAFSLVLDDLGNPYVTGGSDGGNGSDYVTVKYDPNGNQLWVVRYDSLTSESDVATALVLCQV